SKAYGLAGLRVGYALGPVAILDAARATAIPLSVTGVASEAAIASLDAEVELLERVRHIATRRDAVWRGLLEQGEGR
ncbi:aminotransferase class I/II-fold pyridoxal phosphate-dependent enzyme, partial [Rhizobium johnstonii]|uniref:aminotransferase class I/II-fold pyridoxal phosphate-dependent enzyme n=1 Tax=Rhizobium johnstonii TaxID=3019933 RepID=UPI003F9E0AFF